MPSVEIETTIGREPADVFAVHSDFRKRPLWHEHVLSSELLTGEPIGVGSRFRTRNRSGGFILTTQEQITLYDPPHQYCYQLESGPLHFVSRQRFAAVAGGTRYQLHVEITGRNWLGRLVLPLVVAQQRPHFQAAVEEFKQYLEAFRS